MFFFAQRTSWEFLRDYSLLVKLLWVEYISRVHRTNNESDEVMCQTSNLNCTACKSYIPAGESVTPQSVHFMSKQNQAFLFSALRFMWLRCIGNCTIGRRYVCRLSFWCSTNRKQVALKIIEQTKDHLRRRYWWDGKEWQEVAADRWFLAITNADKLPTL